MADMQEMANELRVNPPDENDTGHTALLQDLMDLLREAKDYHFHDFRNKDYATPKVELRMKLLALAEKVVAGKYDNPASSWPKEDFEKVFGELIAELPKTVRRGR